MNSKFIEAIKQSGYIHRPLELNEEHSLESKQNNHTVLEEKCLFDSEHFNHSDWTRQGVCDLRMLPSQELQLSSPSLMPNWPEGAPEDGDYVNFGTANLVKRFARENWENFNRITLEVFPNFTGVPNAYIMLRFKNQGVIQVPDIYHREGYHGINLKNHEWNTVHLEIQGLPRDAITELSIGYYLVGKERTTGDELELRLRKVKLEKVEEYEISKGWLPKPNDIIYSHSGYSLSGIKTAFASQLPAERFQVKHAETNEIAYTGDIDQMETDLGKFHIMDFSKFDQEGRYYLQVGALTSDPFTIGSSEDIWHASIWKSLNFIFCERCGYPVPGIHGSCHADIVAQHEGTILSFNGGWHDAGDVSQQLIQTAEVTLSLFEMAEKVKLIDKNLYLRLLEEGEWGLDFMLKTRFGDGFRATSAGITRWTDGRIGNMDDAEARVHNQAYENFYCAGIEAYISSQLADNPALSNRLHQIAKEDFQFAITEFEQHGFEQKPIFWEHTYQTSESLYMATASWAASMLYRITKDEWYALKAAEFIAYVQDCQELEGVVLDNNSTLSGFFYRHPNKQVVQHFNHQAREHLYMLALIAVHETQNDHPRAESWLQSIQAYGQYLKDLATYTLPYPMISSGIYHIEENLDEKSFNYQHILTDHRAREDYQHQLKHGVKLNDSYYLRKFPVWFSFRGNNAIILSTGKAASLAATYLQDRTLKEIAEGQLQWIVGKNPFGQSLMYGEGYRYAQQYSVMSGEMTGEIPVGIQTFGNEDEPYWPQFNNATYKEVWTGNAGKWLSIIADLYTMDI
ncbi:glycoside hydrolase family 9 protein [Paenibacillus segetis]|uniref:Endoglucanase n=1 Tax=Paenibacillus segetis TaxID=1325360 RepID=A0ABQ1YN15_9BACL|nr:glycoside hydrolase family 9 protein [Paenibacillus segetis]GGH30637.1 endoglucanase [Paenibacillus segetis]